MYVSGATTERRNFLFREIIIFRWVFIKIIFEVCRNFCISFVVFGAVYRPSSRVDYTERRKTERKNVFQLHHRPTTERRNIKRKKIKRFLNFIKVCHNEFFERTT